MNTLVSFKLAKLLKEKKIKIDTEEVIFYRDEIYNIEEHQVKNRDILYNYKGFGDYIADENEYQTYRIAEIVMWLYEKHEIWILALPTATGYFAYKIVDVQLDPEKPIERPPYKDVSSNDYKSPTEAYTSAIAYCLTNLI